MYGLGMRKKARSSPGKYYVRYIVKNCDIFPTYFKQIIEMLYLYQSSKKHFGSRVMSCKSHSFPSPF